MWKRCKALFLCLALGLLVSGLPARAQDAAVVKAIQAKCAGTKDTDSPLRRLRVDGVTVKGDTAMVSGVMLRGGVGDYETENQALTKGLILILKEVLPGKLLNVEGVKEWNVKDLPHLKLQEKAEAVGRDEVILSPVRFDETGTAILNACVGTEGDKAWLQDLALKSFPEDPKLKLKIETTIIKQRFVASVLQQKLAEAGGNRLLVERIRFQWIITKKDTGDLLDKKVIVEGFHLEGAIKNEELVKFVMRLWPELFNGPEKQIKTEISSKILDDKLKVPVANLVKVLQNAVAANPILDGVRIETGLLFNADGKVILKGVLPSTDEKLVTELARSLQKAATDEDKISVRDGLTYSQVIRRGVLANGMSLVRTNLLLAELRAWAAENVDDLLLSRMNFNPDGKLTLHITSPNDDVDGKVHEEFKSRAAVLPYFKKHDGEEFLTHKKRFSESFISFLRKMVELDQKTWEGVLIERGFFRFDSDPHGVYTIAGVTDREEQPAALLRFIQAQQADKKWAEYLGVTPDRVQMDVLPLAPMLDRLKRVCPGYVEFDSVELTGVVQQPSKGLVFSGNRFNPNVKLDLAGKKAELLLKSHPQWKRRARDGVTFDMPPRTFLNDESRWLRPYIAADALARFDFSRAHAELKSLIRHSPDSVAIWYLSAIYHLAIGDDELVRRDLTRVIMMETERVPGAGLSSNEDRQERLALTERIQGARRANVDRLELDLRRKIGDGASQIKLLADSE
jgi:hypothetical protein